MSDEKHLVTLHAPIAEVRATTHPMVERVLANSPDAATLREVMLIVVVAAAVSLILWFLAGMP